MKQLKFDSDKDLHHDGCVCATCLTDYPRPHAQNSCPGNLHAEYRFNLDAGGTEVLIVECCDFCDYQHTETVTDTAQREAALSFSERKTLTVETVKDSPADDEPFFTLRARDAFAVPVIMSWLNLAVSMGVRLEKQIACNRLLRDMIAWQRRHKTKIPD